MRSRKSSRRAAQCYLALTEGQLGLLRSHTRPLRRASVSVGPFGEVPSARLVFVLDGFSGSSPGSSPPRGPKTTRPAPWGRLLESRPRRRHQLAYPTHPGYDQKRWWRRATYPVPPVRRATPPPPHTAAFRNSPISPLPSLQRHDLLDCGTPHVRTSRPQSVGDQ
jgi:hypothetical protein